MDVQEVPSHKKKGLFLIDGYLYEGEKKRGSKHYCRCVRYKNEKCLARAIMEKVGFGSRSFLFLKV